MNAVAAEFQGELIARLLARIEALEKRVFAPPVDMIRIEPRRALISELAVIVSQKYDLSVADLRGPDRHFKIAHPRQHLMLLAHDAGHSTGKIGRYLGGRDHTTILHGIKAARERLAG
jgi:chromosomal replication initiation ATPase DnaA